VVPFEIRRLARRYRALREVGAGAVSRRPASVV